MERQKFRLSSLKITKAIVDKRLEKISILMAGKTLFQPTDA